MVRAWNLNESLIDDTLIEKGHETDREYVDLETLKKDTGVLYWQLNGETFVEDGSLDSIKSERGYNYEDEIEVSREKLPNCEAMIKKFAHEHLHTDEEIRFITAGYGFFDVRHPRKDYWIRVEVNKGDLLVLPAGIYHRLVLPNPPFIKAKRLFVGEPVWTAHNRPEADSMECREKYLSCFS